MIVKNLFKRNAHSLLKGLSFLVFLTFLNCIFTSCKTKDAPEERLKPAENIAFVDRILQAPKGGGYKDPDY